MSGERVGFRFKHADAVVKRNPQGRSRRGWVIEPVEQTTSRGTKMPAYKFAGEIVRGLKLFYSIC